MMTGQATRHALALLALFFSVGAGATDFHGVPLRCIATAAQRYGLTTTDVYAILRTEGGRPGSIVPDPNGTSDLGPTQVNTCHLPFLSSYGYTLHILASNPCANVMAGSWIYARCLNATGGLLQAAACYNAGRRPWLAWNSGYVQRFAANLGLASAPLVVKRNTVDLVDSTRNPMTNGGLL